MRSVGEKRAANSSGWQWRHAVKNVCTLAAINLCASVIACAQTTQRYPDPPPFEKRRYEDRHTFKNGKTYTADPYVWAYTREFAQLFRMPEQWIDDNLKGVLAVAFRMNTIGNLACGYGGREESCWPPLECQMDVYYDARIKLPWVHDEIVRDFLMRGVSSHEFLQDLSDSKGIRRYASKEIGYPMVLRGGGVIEVGKFHSGGASITYFDREYQPGIGLIGWMGTGVCPRPIGTGRMYFYDMDTDDKISHMKIKAEDAKPMHIFEISESFMRRANAAYVAQSKPNNEVTQRLMKQFFESRQPVAKP